MGNIGSHMKKSHSTLTIDSPIQSTWGPSPRGKMWISREGIYSADGIGHLSVLIDLGGYSTYRYEYSTVPDVFSGIQIQLVLKKKKKGVYTRQAVWNFTYWPQPLKGGEQRVFDVDTKCYEVVPVDGFLDPMCPWEDLKGPQDWWARLKTYLETRIPAYVARLGHTAGPMQSPDVVAQNIQQAARESAQNFRTKVNKTHPYWRAVDIASHWNAEDDSDIALNALNPIMEWDEAHNSHTFAFFIVEDALHMKWPTNFVIRPAYYAKQFTAAILSMVPTPKV